MKGKMVWKDIYKNKAVSFAAMLFIVLAAMLLSAAAILTVNLSGSIDRLMETAKTPHFMQMHSGEPDARRLEEFVEEYENVEACQIKEFLNVDSEGIVMGESSLAGNLQDNGFCTQSGAFDFLLDQDNVAVQPGEGELYVPVCYLRDGTAKVGDRAVINGIPFVVTGFVRDSQMNSSLASSKRFVVSEVDFDRLKPTGTMEYLIEFRLKDMSGLGAFEAAYGAAGLPANGPALTWPLFRMMSALSDGIMIAVILLISLLVLLIALLCVRFTLLAKIEDDYREIGIMKAIGLRTADIRSIYLTVYAVIAGAGCVTGFLLSLLLREPLLESIRANLGDGGNTASALLLGLAGVLLVFCFILFYVSRVLRRFRSISAASAVRSGADPEEAGNTGKLRLSGNRFLPVNLFLGLRDVLKRKRLYATMLAVTVLACFIMVVPQNLYHTISDDRFVTYMGVGLSDIRLDIQRAGDIVEKVQDIGTYLGSDQAVERYAAFVTKTYGVRLKDGSLENIKVELGDHSVFPLQYVSGRRPASEAEIALSAINADEWGKAVGDEVTLVTAGGERRLTVSGIYSDITNGGKTAKAVFTDLTADAAWGTVCVELKDSGRIGDRLAEYGERFGYAKVSGVEEYMTQTFGQTLRSVRSAALAGSLVAMAVVLLVVLLFMRLLAVKDRYSIGVLRALGFTGNDIVWQYVWRAVFVLAAGIIIGTILAGTLGEKLAGAAISSLGAASFRFTVNPLFTYVLSPLLLLAAALAATVRGTRGAGRVLISDSIKE